MRTLCLRSDERSIQSPDHELSGRHGWHLWLGKAMGGQGCSSQSLMVYLWKSPVQIYTKSRRDEALFRIGLAMNSRVRERLVDAAKVEMIHDTVDEETGLCAQFDIVWLLQWREDIGRVEFRTGGLFG